MQPPTLTNVHIRTVSDAHKLFYAVQLGLLPKIERRLDAHERGALRPGNVYVWEEKGPGAITSGSADANGTGYAVTMERFTEGKSWTASRVRDDFLMYYESTKKKKGDRDEAPQRARSLENQIVREGERDLYIKLTYSVYRTDDAEINNANSGPSSAGGQGKDKDKNGRKSKKWHLNAYFTKFTEGQLRTIDDIPFLKELNVPEGLYKTARTTAKSAAGATGTKRSHTSLMVSPDYSKGPGATTASGGAGAAGQGGSNAGGKGAGVQRTYAPFPSSHPRVLRSAANAPLSGAAMGSAEMKVEERERMATATAPPPGTKLPSFRHDDGALPRSLPSRAASTAGVVVPPLTTALPPSDLPTTSSLLSQLRGPNSTSTDNNDGLEGSSSSGSGSGSVSPHPQHFNSAFPPYASQPSYAYSFSSSTSSSSTSASSYPSYSSHLALTSQMGFEPRETRTPALSDTSSHSHASSPYSVDNMDMEFDDASGSTLHVVGVNALSSSSSGGYAYTYGRVTGGGAGFWGGGIGMVDEDQLRMLISLEDPEEDLSSYLPAPPPSSSLSSSLPSSSSHTTRATSIPIPIRSSASPRILHAQSSSSSSSGWSGDESSASHPHPTSTSSPNGRKRRRGGSQDGTAPEPGCRVALAPLHSLQRNHPYRRSEVDDRALRLLGPGA